MQRMSRGAELAALQRATAFAGASSNATRDARCRYTLKIHFTREAEIKKTSGMRIELPARAETVPPAVP